MSIPKSQGRDSGAGSAVGVIPVAACDAGRAVGDPPAAPGGENFAPGIAAAKGVSLREALW